MRSAQELFDIAATHLLTQNKRAGARGACFYRTNDGLKCAVGALIPDELYDADMERRSIIGLINGCAYLQGTELRAELSTNREMLLGLQRIHDDYPEERWPERLKSAASEFGLSTAVVDNFKAAA